MRLLCVGVACVDVLDELDAFPREDSEQRSMARTRRLGGNAANTAMIASQCVGLDVGVMFATSREERDPNVAFVRNTLDQSAVEDLGIDVSTDSSYLLPSSHIIQCPGTRTILHFRDLAELAVKDFVAKLETWKPPFLDWVHFEGRNIAETKSILSYLVEGEGRKWLDADCQISVEIEKERPGGDVLVLVPFAHVIVFSKAFCVNRGHTCAQDMLAWVQKHWLDLGLRPTAKVVVAWGDQGAFGLESSSGTCFHAEAVPVEKIADSVGAGDSFNAGLIAALMKRQLFQAAVSFGNSVAAMKLQHQGFVMDQSIQV